MKMSMMVLLCLAIWSNLFASSLVVTSDITTNTTWNVDTVFLAKSGFAVMGGARLTIKPGTVVKFRNGVRCITVHGTITAVGTDNDSIRFSQEDSMVSWQGIRLLNRASGFSGYDSSYLKFCIFENTQCISTDSLYMKRGGAVYCGAGNYVEIDNSKVIKNWGYHGGAIYVDSGAVAHISNSYFENNTTDFYGGGAIMSNDNGNKELLVKNCRFDRNYARTGGAVRVGKGTKAQFNNCVFYRDTTFSINPEFNDLKGGAIAIFGPADVTMRNCIMFYCRSYEKGGAVYSSDASLKLINCTIANNFSVYGGGVYLGYDSVASSPVLVNTIEGGNGKLKNIPRDSAGCGIYLDSFVTPILRNCQMFDTVYDHTIKPYTGQFINCRYYKTEFFYRGSMWEVADTVVEGYQLYSNLGIDDPAINSGTLDTTGLGLSGLDLIGNKRINGNAIDIGAIEYQGISSIHTSFFKFGNGELQGNGLCDMTIYALNGQKLGAFRTNITSESVQKIVESKFLKGIYLIVLTRSGTVVGSKNVFVK